MTHYDTIVRGGTVVCPAGIIAADIAIAGETIVAIAPDIEGSTREEIAAGGLHVFPGVVDIHVHFNEPGRTAWEGWATGSAACAVGGTTTVAEMPLNAHPPTLDGLGFDAKLAAAAAQSYVDFALWGGLTPLNLNRMEELAERGVIGFKAFMSNSGIADFPAADDATLLVGMRQAAELGLPIAVHAENDAITAALSAQAVAAGRMSARDFLASRPAIAESEAIIRAIHLAEETGCILHVVHVSTGRGIAEIAAARRRGVDVTAETCPHYLLFDEDDLDRLGAIAKCAPPLRPRADGDALWRSLATGDIHVVASDHSPAPADLKAGNDYFQMWGGISGSQSLLSAVLSAGHAERGMSLASLAAVLAEGPAQRLQMPAKGAIAVGAAADLVLVDLGERFTLLSDDLRYRHRHSPFEGMEFTGKPLRTILRGDTVAIAGQTVGASRGQLVKPKPSR